MSADGSDQVFGAMDWDGGSDLPGTLQGIAESTRTTLGADRATLYVVDIDTQVISGVYTTETNAKRRAYLERSVGAETATLPIWRLHLGQPDPLLAIEDLEHDATIPHELAGKLGAGAILCVRLEHGSVRAGNVPALMGTLCCSYQTARSFSPAQRQAARGLAGVATLALANARLQIETAQNLECAARLAGEQAALLRVATAVATEGRPETVFMQAAEEVAGLLAVDFGLVARFEADRAQPVGWAGHVAGTPFPLEGGGALAQVARTGRVARVDDYGALATGEVGQIVRGAGYRSGVAAPVHVGGHLWGALLAATSDEIPIAPDAEVRLERFSNLVSVAIANAEAQARLVAQAANDPLTGLANHRTFFEHLNSEVQRARRRGDRLSLIIFDLDYFKRINDTYGHLAGDVVLIETAARFEALSRAEDTVARIGGEEFAWLLPDCDARAAWLAAERARRAIADTPYPEVGKMTVSAGVAELRDDMSVTELFRRADAALYAAKGQGRDVCTLHSPGYEEKRGGQSGSKPGRVASVVERLVSLAHEQLALTAAVLAEFRDGSLVVRHVAGDVEAFGLPPGAKVPLNTTYCARMVEGGLPHVIRDAQRDGLAREMPITRTAGIGAYVGEPVMLPNGDVYGTLFCLSRHAEPGLSAGDAHLLHVIAGILADELELANRSERDRGLKRDGLHRVLDGDGLSVVLQPIVDLSCGDVIAVEALSRFAVEPRRSPDAWFADAADLGLDVELELLAVRTALTHLDELPPGTRLSLNLSPATLCSPGLLSALSGTPGERLAVEVTEHAAVEDYAALKAALASLRARGVQLMIDDAGAGFASFKHVVDLRPDVIKLDLSLTRDIDTDPLRRALAASLLTFADEIGATIVAEGIETYAELETLRALGVTHGQGYLLARPAEGPAPRHITIEKASALHA